MKISDLREADRENVRKIADYLTGKGLQLEIQGYSTCLVPRGDVIASARGSKSAAREIKSELMGLEETADGHIRTVPTNNPQFRMSVYPPHTLCKAGERSERYVIGCGESCVDLSLILS